MPSGLEVAVYAVIRLPPFEPHIEKLTDACPFPAVALTPVGASGTAVGVTLFEGLDGAPVSPALFVAVTVKVYAIPFVRPVTVIGLAPVWVIPPGFEVAVYELMELPPLERGGVKLTFADPLPATVAETPVGGPGAAEVEVGVTLFDAAEAGPVPAALVAVTVKV
jgi:hypothetical protein